MTIDRPQRATTPPAPGAPDGERRGPRLDDTSGRRATLPLTVDEIRMHWQADIDRRRITVRITAGIAVTAVLACAALACRVIAHRGNNAACLPRHAHAAGSAESVRAGAR